MGDNVCNRCKGGTKLILGVVVLANWYLSSQGNGVDWWLLVGVVLVLLGLLSYSRPGGCGHMETPAPARKRR